MADSQRIFDPGARFVDANGDPLAGGTLYFYQAGTSTPRTVYTDADLLTVLGTSCTLDAGGYPTTDGNTKTLIHTGLNAYKVILKDSSGNTIATHDNIKGALDTSGFTTTYAIGTSPVVSKTAAYTILTSDKGKHFACDPTGGSFALTLPSAVTAGDGFRLYVSHNADSDNVVNILPVGSQTIGGKTGTTVNRRAAVTLVSDGANWRIESNRFPFFKGIIEITDRLTAPPSSPTAGARYIINGTPTGTWSTLGFSQHDIAEADGNGSWIKHTPRNGWTAFVADENLFTKYYSSAWTDLDVATPTTSYLGVANFEAQYASGTAGTSATSGAWTKATINTEVYNTITSAALASSVVTLPAGRYTVDANIYVSISGLASTQQFGLRVRDTTAGANLAFVAESVAGAEINTNNAVAPSKRVRLRGVFTLSTTTTIELQYNITVSSGAITIGSPGSFSVNEVYSQLIFMSLATAQGPTGSQGPQGALMGSAATDKVGYTTGAGGTVTQATSRTTGVTINTPSGAITLVSAAGSTTPASFTVTNSRVTASDVPKVVQKSGTDKYIIHVTAVAAGSFQITFWTTGGTTTEQPVFNFNVDNGATS